MPRQRLRHKHVKISVGMFALMVTPAIPVSSLSTLSRAHAMVCHRASILLLQISSPMHRSNTSTPQHAQGRGLSLASNTVDGRAGDSPMSLGSGKRGRDGGREFDKEERGRERGRGW